MKLRTALFLVLLSGCHRDLDDGVECPAGGCVDSSAPPDGDAEASDSTATGDADADASSDACSTLACTTPPPATCPSAITRRVYASPGTCVDAGCVYAPTDVVCPMGEGCEGGFCIPPSCKGGLICGTGSCCDAKTVPGGTFQMGRATTGAESDACSTWADPCSPVDQPEHTATVSAFRLDTYEVTVGRFRNFVPGYPANKPVAGAGAHPLIAGTGWKSDWDPQLPPTAVELVAALKCDPALATWTDSPAMNENKPINCIDWFTAFAFCAWDGGRLPTEAEWEYAAAGGDENRVSPWGNMPPSAMYAAAVNCGLSCTLADIPSVGSKPLGAARWGQADFADSVAEWTLDWFAPYTSAPVTNYAQIIAGTGRAVRGASFMHDRRHFRSAARFEVPPNQRYPYDGFRCARKL